MADEQPCYVESEEVVAELEDKPAKGTPEYAELEQFRKEVVLILQTVNDNEHKAALSVLEPPSATFTAPVIFPMPNMVAGKLEGWKVVLIKAGAGRAVGDYVEDALKRYCNARFVIGVGVCFAFVQEVEANQCKFADVLVSKSIRDNLYMKFEDKEIKDLGQKINVVYELHQIFCTQAKKQLKFEVSASRKSVMHCGTFCCNTFLIKDEAIRDAFHRLNTGDIGGEMEGGELLKLQQDHKVEGVIVIKGVADFADKDKAKHWQYTAAKAALHYIKVQLRNTDELEVSEKKVSTTLMTSPNGSAVPHQLGGSSNLPVDVTPNGNTSVPAALPNHHAVAAVPTSSSRMATDSDDYQTAGRLPDDQFEKIKKIVYRYPHKWRSIGQGLGFTYAELDAIQDKPALFNDAPDSYLKKMLIDWYEWHPGDDRRSKGVATKEDIATAVSQAGLGVTAETIRNC